jgi:hypothetical protein
MQSDRDGRTTYQSHCNFIGRDPAVAVLWFGFAYCFILFLSSYYCTLILSYFVGADQG